VSERVPAQETIIADPISIFLTLAAVVFLALQLEKRVGVFRSLGAALTGILIGMLLSNTGLLPGNSPTYDFLMVGSESRPFNPAMRERAGRR
jgi:hypothetical protein